MKLKKILVIAVVLLSIFLIYLSTIDKKVYYLALGDSLSLGMTPYGGRDSGFTDTVKDYLKKNHLLEEYISGYAKNGYRITDVKRDIEDNRRISVNGKERTLKNALIKADLVTLSVGSNDLFSKLMMSPSLGEKDLYNYIDEIIIDLESLMKVLRQYCKEDILLLGYYNPLPSLQTEKMKEILRYANDKTKAVSLKYDITFVPTYALFEANVSYLPNPKDIHPSREGYQAIGNEIVKILEDSMLKK